MLQLFTACSLVLPPPAPKETIYVLGENLTFQRYGKIAKRPLRIWISDVEGSSLINSRKILFSREPSVRGEYQLATWSETPPARFAELLGNALTTFNIFKTVSVGDNLANADIALNAKISEFYHDATLTPPVVRVSVSVTLLNLHTRNKIAENTFEKNIPFSENNVKGAVRGFDQAVQEIIEDIAVWLSAAKLK